MPWIIDRDLIADLTRKAPCNANAVGMMGPRGYAGDGSELNHRFRMLDDDGNVYYEGRNDTQDDDNAFGPLEDFGTPNAGCTDIQYRVRGKWQSL